MTDLQPTHESTRTRADDTDKLVVGITYFPDLQAKTQKFEQLTWRELLGRVASPPTYPSKVACPLIKLASFGTEPSDKGSLRHDKNLQVIYGLEGDYDAGEVSVDQAAERLSRAGVEAVVYTTASHTNHAPRWRVLTPLATPCNKWQRRTYMDRLNAVLGGCLAMESNTASQSYYFGRVHGSAYEQRHSAGAPIDQLAIDVPVRGEAIATASQAAESWSPEASEFERQAQLNDVDSVTFEHLTSALGAISADDRQMWVRIGHALAWFKGTEFESSAERLWLQWSATSKKFDAQRDPPVWDSFKADRTGYAVVFKVAQECGWRNPNASVNTLDAKALTDVIARCRALPTKELMTDWAELALSLGPAQLPTLLDEVSHLTRIPISALKATLKQAKSEATKAVRQASIAARAAGRQVIPYRPEDRTEHALDVERLIMAKTMPGAYLQFGGQLARVTIRPFVGTRRVGADTPPSVPHIELLDDVGALQEIERVAMFVKQSGENSVPIAVPSDVIEVLLKKPSHAAAVVAGLVSHPIVIPSTGEIVAVDGLHKETGLYLHGSEINDVRPYNQKEAAVALSRLKKVFLEGFEFASALDEDIAIAGLLTGIERKVCDTAPGFAGLASVQASGKTTLVRRMHLVLTGHDMPITSFPDRDEAELQKRLLTILIRAPALVCFDNILDGTTFRSAPLAAAMTSPVLTQRLLGASKDTSCPTNVLFCITGNNLSLGPDELTRWLVCRLQPAAVRPEARVFAHTDVVGHALEIRREVLRDALGIVAGYRRLGGGIAPASRFPVWDSVVRQPLIWAGGEDVAQCFSANADASEERQAHAALVGCLHAKFKNREFTAADVASMVSDTFYGGGDPFDISPAVEGQGLSEPQSPGFLDLTYTELAEATRSALFSLQSKDPRNESSVGRVLKSLINTRTTLVLPTGNVGAHIGDRMLRGRRMYRIVV